MIEAGVAEAAKIYHCTDGTSWSLAKTNLKPLYSLWGSQSNDVWALGSNEAFHYDGTQWKPVSLDPPLHQNGQRDQIFESIWGSAPNDLWVASRSFYTTGKSWFGHYDGTMWTWTPYPNWSSQMAVDKNPTRTPKAMWGTGENVWTVGEYQTIVAYKNKHWAVDPMSSRGVLWFDRLKALSTEDLRSKLLETDLKSVWVRNESDIWVGGYSSVVLHYDGKYWKQVTLPILRDGSFETISSILGFAENDVWMVGADGGEVLHYDGSEVKSVYPPAGTRTTPKLSKIWGTSSTNLWIGAEKEQILHYDGQNFTFTKLTGSPFKDDDIVGIWGTQANNVWALSHGGTLYHYDGTSWKFKTEDPGLASNLGASGYSDLFGTGPDNIWAVGTQRLLVTGMGLLIGPAGLLHYDGAKWSQVAKDFYTGLSSVWGRGPNDMWISTRGGETYHFDGTSWTFVATGVSGSSGLAQIRGLPDGQIWAAGGKTAILHYHP